MTQHQVFPFEYQGDPVLYDTESIAYYDVMFTSNFGPVAQGEMFYGVRLLMDQGILICEIDDTNDEEEDDNFIFTAIHVVHFKCVPKEQ